MLGYVKSKKGYDDNVFEEKKIKEVRGIPYQVLLRMFIVEGFKKLKKAG